MISPTATITHPAKVTVERTTADPLGVKVAFARGWYANHPKDAIPVGVKSLTTIVMTPAPRSTTAPTQPSFAPRWRVAYRSERVRLRVPQRNSDSGPD